MMQRLLIALLANLVLVGGAAAARDRLQIVSSVATFPYAATVSERFARTTHYPAPRVLMTGTGAGLRMFCAGLGPDYPDIVGANRPMSDQEFERCRQQGIRSITEFKIGHNGIVFAKAEGANTMNLSKHALFAAIAKHVIVDGHVVENPHRTWKDVDPALPNQRIEVVGPPPGSPLRDSFLGLVMAEGCMQHPGIDTLSADRRDEVCTMIRTDGRYVQAPENSVEVVQRLHKRRHAVGILDCVAYELFEDLLDANALDGVAPDFETISDGRYSASFALYMYVKNQHYSDVPGMLAFVNEQTSERAFGPEGYLTDDGLIPLNPADRLAARATAIGLNPMFR